MRIEHRCVIPKRNSAGLIDVRTVTTSYRCLICGQYWHVVYSGFVSGVETYAAFRASRPWPNLRKMRYQSRMRKEMKRHVN